MLVNASDLPAGTTLRASVCIVGAGPAGLSVAARLAGAGVDVVLLEAGGGATPHADLETVVSTGLPYDTPAKRGRGLGGGALTWNVRTPVGDRHLRLRELEPLDLQARPGVRETSWPLAEDDLGRAYRDAWALFGLPPAEPDPHDHPDGTGTADHEVRTFRLGPSTPFTRDLPDALARDPLVRVVTGAVATGLRADDGSSRTSSLELASAPGRRTVVEAEVYVLAGGAIENARLLLASTAAAPAGVGNAHDNVGRYFMEHPHYDSGVVLPGDHRLSDRPELWDVHARGGVALQRKQALSSSGLRRHGLLETALFLRTRSPRDVVVVGREGADVRRSLAVREWRVALGRGRLPDGARATARDVLASLPQVAWRVPAQSLAWQASRAGRAHVAPPRVMTLRGMAEQLPNPLSRVRLSSTVDVLGMPVAELDWRLTDADWSSMTRAQEVLAPHLERVLGGTVHSLVDPERTQVVGGSHQMGTTRMSSSPRDGVVDPDGRVHGMRNLYVTGASVFPTGGSANPTLTVVALALRLADHLSSRLAATAGAHLPGSGPDPRP